MNGKVSSAKNLIYDCVVVTQNRHCITILDRAAYGELNVREERERERETEERVLIFIASLQLKIPSI